MTADGVKAFLAVTLTTLSSGKTVLILYDNSGATRLIHDVARTQEETVQDAGTTRGASSG